MLNLLLNILLCITPPTCLEQLPGWNADKVIIKEIGGGATNKNYIITLDDKKYFMRMSVPNESLGLTENHEYGVMKKASDAGFAPAIILYAPQDHILVSDFIEGKPPTSLPKIGKLIRSFHESSIFFDTATNPYDILRQYNKSCRQVWIQDVLALESSYPADHHTPCHLDIHKGNLMETPEKIWMIDWEYASMSDPYFDLATICSADNLTDEQMKELLHAYGETDFARLYAMRIVADARWALWSIIQNETSDLDQPFEEWAHAFTQRAKDRLHDLEKSVHN